MATDVKTARLAPVKETMADDIATLIGHLGFAKANLMGFSLGGAVVLGTGIRQRDAGWDRSGKTHHRLAILPGVPHYDINVAPGLPQAVMPFLAGA